VNASLSFALLLFALGGRAQDVDVPQPAEPGSAADAAQEVPAQDAAPQDLPRVTPGAQDPTPADGAPQADAEPASEPEPDPVPPMRFDFTREIGAEELAAQLLRIGSEQDDLVAVTSIGKSRAGRDILLVTVGDRRVGNPDRRPALFVTADLAAADAPRAGAQAGLFAVLELVARAREDADTAALLQRATVYVVPAPDPDALEELVLHDQARLAAEPISASMRLEREDGQHGRVALNENFPVGWQPFAREPGNPSAQGPYPLCEPESLALARSLLERRNIAACVVATRRAGGLGGGCEPGVAAHDTLRRLDLADELERALCARSDLADEPGSLSAFCGARLASLSFFAPAWDGAGARETPLGPAPPGFADAFELVLALLSELPRIEPGEVDVERLRPDLWQIDLSLAAAGALCVTPRGPRPVEGLSVSAKGGAIELVALRRAGESAFRPIDAARSGTADAQRGEHGLGTLEGGAPIAVRLVVRAAPQSQLELVLCSSAAGKASVLALLE
jgi:hypothetical protein